MLPIAVCIFAFLALLVAERIDSTAGRAVAKLTASTAFVWAAISWGALGSSYGLVMLLGLLLCWLGDALLLPAGQTLWFQLGIGAFLLGHVAYAMAFVGLGTGLGVLLGASVALGVFAFTVLRWLWPHVPGEFRGPVVSYVLVISAMVVTAIAAVGGGAPMILAVGAVGFAASDISVARERFVSSSFLNSAWGLPAYYLSQLALAWSVAAVPPIGV